MASAVTTNSSNPFRSASPPDSGDSIYGVFPFIVFLGVRRNMSKVLQRNNKDYATVFKSLTKDMIRVIMTHLDDAALGLILVAEMYTNNLDLEVRYNHIISCRNTPHWNDTLGRQRLLIEQHWARNPGTRGTNHRYVSPPIPQTLDMSTERTRSDSATCLTLENDPHKRDLQCHESASNLEPHGKHETQDGDTRTQKKQRVSSQLDLNDTNDPNSADLSLGSSTTLNRRTSPRMTRGAASKVVATLDPTTSGKLPLELPSRVHPDDMLEDDAQSSCPPGYLPPLFLNTSDTLCWINSVLHVRNVDPS